MSQATFRYERRRKRRHGSNGQRGRLEWGGMQRDDIQWNDSYTSVVVDDGVTRIEEDAFLNDPNKYNSLQHVTISRDVETIGKLAFCGCRFLVELEISQHSRLTSIEQGAFAGCASLKKANLPSSLRILGDWAFFQCGLREFTFQREASSSTHLCEIRGFCFALCELKEIDFSHCPLLTTISACAFASCKHLEIVRLPLHLERIGLGAFGQCESLREIVFPNTLRCIETHNAVPFNRAAFNRCTKLTTVEFKSMQTITPQLLRSPSPFKGCTALHTIRLPGHFGSDDEAALAKSLWAGAIYHLFLHIGGLLGPESSQAQRSSCVYEFLQARMEELLA